VRRSLFQQLLCWCRRSCSRWNNLILRGRCAFSCGRYYDLLTGCAGCYRRAIRACKREEGNHCKQNCNGEADQPAVWAAGTGAIIGCVWWAVLILIVCGHDKYSVLHGPQALFNCLIAASQYADAGAEIGYFWLVFEIKRLICLRQAVLHACKTSDWVCCRGEEAETTKKSRETGPGLSKALNDATYSASAALSAASWSTLARGGLPSSNSFAWTTHSSRSTRPPSDSFSS